MWCTKILQSTILSLEVTIVCFSFIFSYRLLLLHKNPQNVYPTPVTLHFRHHIYIQTKKKSCENMSIWCLEEPEHSKLLLSVHALTLPWQIAEVSNNAVRMVKLLHSQHSSTLIGGLSKRLLLANSCLSLSTCTDPVAPLERSHHLMGPVTQWRSGRPYILLKSTQKKESSSSPVQLPWLIAEKHKNLDKL